MCRKCSKKLGGGFGPDGRMRLAKSLRRDLGAEGKLKLKKGRSRTAVLETGCLGLCPKGAVVVIRPGPSGGCVLVPKGSATPAVALALGLDA